METLYLASGSPRRKEILDNLGIPCIMLPQKVDETFQQNSPREEAVRLAAKKVNALLKTSKEPPPWVLGGDTFLLFQGSFIGKPSDRTEARQILRTLSGREHAVMTGLAFFSPSIGVTTGVEETLVRFAPLSDREIDWYLDTEEWKGAAGAYRMQEKGGFLIQGIEGSPSNVVGLPIRLFYGMVRHHKYPLNPRG
ncbi:MAG: septum formation protein Maf [Spirochaetales bacterium]|nr:septum formation protein Maf [Spirochaetales bacterium]